MESTVDGRPGSASPERGVRCSKGHPTTLASSKRTSSNGTTALSPWRPAVSPRTNRGFELGRPLRRTDDVLLEMGTRDAAWAVSVEAKGACHDDHIAGADLASRNRGHLWSGRRSDRGGSSRGAHRLHRPRLCRSPPWTVARCPAEAAGAFHDSHQRAFLPCSLVDHRRRTVRGDHPPHLEALVGDRPVSSTAIGCV